MGCVQSVDPYLIVCKPALHSDGWSYFGYGLDNNLIINSQKQTGGMKSKTRLYFWNISRNATTLCSTPISLAAKLGNLPHGHAIYSRVSGRALDMEFIDTSIAYGDLGKFLTALQRPTCHAQSSFPSGRFPVSGSRVRTVV